MKQAHGADLKAYVLLKGVCLQGFMHAPPKGERLNRKLS